MIIDRQSMVMEGVILILGVNFIQRMDQKQDLLVDVAPVNNQKSSTVIQSWTCPCLLRGNWLKSKWFLTVSLYILFFFFDLTVSF